MIAYKRTGKVRLYKDEDVSFNPSGWHPPHEFFYLGDMKPRIRPAKKRPSRVYLPGQIDRLNTCRVVPTEYVNQLALLDQEICALVERKTRLIEDNFLSFPLLEENQVKRSYEKVYTTKAQAIAKAERG